MTNCCPDPDIHCIDSRPRDGYRYRRYKCRHCGNRYSTIEIRIDEELVTGQPFSSHRANLVSHITEKQSRSLLEQIEAGHRSLNLI